MKLAFELVSYCCVFFLLVKLGTGNSGINALYFYPQEYQQIAYERALADQKEVKKKRKTFMTVFLTVLTVLLVGIIHFNRPGSFHKAYLQGLLFLEVMNWFDAIVIDRLWVGHSNLWKIRGMEGIPYVKPWERILRERLILSGIWTIGAVLVAALVMITGGM